MKLTTIADLKSNDAETNEKLFDEVGRLSEEYETWYANQPGDGHLRKRGIHASEVTGCLRRVVYGLRGEPKVEETSSFWRKKFQHGHAIHDMLQRDFENMARATNLMKEGWHLEFHREFPIAPEYHPLAHRWDIQSHLDGIFTIREQWDAPAKFRILVEIKSKAPDGWASMKDVEQAHKEQAHIYMACFDVPLCWFVYYNKGNEAITPSRGNYLVRFDPELWAKLEERFMKAHEHAEENTLPPREEGMTCSFCPYTRSCEPTNKAGTYATNTLIAGLRKIRGKAVP